MKRRSSLLLACGPLTAALLAGACGEGSEGIECTAESRSSVVLSVVDERSRPLADVEVTYQVGDGARQALSCGADGECGIAYETSGAFSITARKAGYQPSSGKVTVTGDVCHVTTERLTLVLRRAP